MSVVAKRLDGLKCHLLGMDVCLGPGDFESDGDPAPRGKKVTAPTQFSAHVYCGQTPGLMKTPLGTEVDLDPGHTVLDRYPAPRLPPAKGTQQLPLFSAMSILATVAHFSYC